MNNWQTKEKKSTEEMIMKMVEDLYGEDARPVWEKIERWHEQELKDFAEEIKDFLRGNDGFMYPIDVDKLLLEKL